MNALELYLLFTVPIDIPLEIIDALEYLEQTLC